MQTQTATTQINEMYREVYKLYNRCRQANGWKPETATEADSIVETWTEIFNHYKIPAQYLDNLYFRAFDARTSNLRGGSKPPDMTPDLLVANWQGANGLKAELDRLRYEEANRNNPNGIYLQDDGKPRCHYCLGTGFREVSRFGAKGVIRCQHEENYVPNYGDEVVGVEEGIEIIKLHLAKKGIAFEGQAKDFANVVTGKFRK